MARLWAEVAAGARVSSGTDQRSALPWQPHLVSEGKLTCQRGSWEVAATAACDPRCMDRRCVAREIGEDGVIWSCANVSGLWVERMWLLAIMEVSAHAILLGDKPRLGCRGHQFSRAPGRPLLHLFLSLSQTSVGNRCATCCRCPFLLFDRAAGFLPPRPREAKAGARRYCQGWPLLRPPSGSALTGSSTTAHWQGRGHLQAGWDVGCEIFLTSKLRP